MSRQVLYQQFGDRETLRLEAALDRVEHCTDHHGREVAFWASGLSGLGDLGSLPFGPCAVRRSSHRTARKAVSMRSLKVRPSWLEFFMFALPSRLDMPGL